MSEDGASRRGVETGQAIKVYMQWAKGASTIVCAWTADGGCRGLIKKTFLRFPVRNYCCAQRKLQSSSLWVDGDETRARERRVGEGSRRKIAARRMQPASPSPSSCRDLRRPQQGRARRCGSTHEMLSRPEKTGSQSSR